MKTCQICEAEDDLGYLLYDHQKQNELEVAILCPTCKNDVLFWIKEEVAHRKEREKIKR